MSDIVERLRSSEPLPACPFSSISPHYLTMPDDKPCPFCGQENTLEGPDKCRGADTRIMGEAANEIVRLRQLLEETVRERENHNGYHQAAVIEIERLRKALGRIQRGSLSVLLDAALSECPINPDVLNEICKDAGEALALSQAQRDPA